MNICRLCLYQGDEKQVLSIWESQIEDLITKDDDLPTCACLSCIHQVTQWVIFKETCEKSNNILLSSFNGNKINVNQEEFKQYVNNTDYCQSAQPPLHYSCENTNARNRKLRKSRKKVLKSEYKCSDESDFENEDGNLDNIYFENEFYQLNYKLENTDNIYKCDICPEEFNNCLEYLDHQGLHNGHPVFQCDKCPKIFSFRKELVEHDRNHRRPCPQCGKMVLKSSMKLHLVKHTDRHMCPHCSGRFNSRAALAQHIITVHTDIKDHICETCGKRFSSQTAMRVHMKSHSDERLYQCKLCSYAGRTASALYVHMSTHANDLCVCEVCSKTFKSNRNLNDHLRRVHSKEKKHECTYCNKKFVDKYMLRVHVRCHTGVRPYQCSYCEKAFIRSDGLKEHMTTHGQRIMYDCKECGKKFTSKRGVTRHTCTSIT